MYLVTRLDRYTENDIFSLIDRSGPSTPVNKISNNFVFDISHVPPGDAAFYDSYMSQSILSVQNSGWNTIYHPDTTRLYDQENVLGYTSVTYVASTTPLNYSWVPGSFAEIMNSQSDEIFNNTAPTADQSLADLISEGLTGGHTYGHPAFFSLILDYKILFDRYTDTLAEFNLAESYYMATKRLSAQDIIIGDPKTSLVIDNVASLGTIESINILIGPNPSFGVLNIDPNGVNIESIEVLNNVGQRVFSSEHKVASKFQLDLSELSKGTYFLHLTTDQGDYRESIILLD